MTGTRSGSVAEDIIVIRGRRYRCVYPPQTSRGYVERVLTRVVSDNPGHTVMNSEPPFVCHEEWICGNPASVVGVVAPHASTYARALTMVRLCPKSFSRLWSGYVEAAKCGSYIALFVWPLARFAILDTRSDDWTCVPRALPRNMELALAVAEAVGRLDRRAADRLLALLSI